MDVSIIAAVGSFVVSERVLKPKATVLIVLGCVLIYDLTTKTHDVSSLRVYRGPSLLAFTLMLVAYSLRTWRRNGVACDELLFLPGTVHGHNHGIEGPLVVEMTTPSQQQQQEQQQSPLSQQQQQPTASPSAVRRIKNSNAEQLEADVAAGGGGISFVKNMQRLLHRRTRSEDEMEPMLQEINNNTGHNNNNNSNNPNNNSGTTMSPEDEEKASLLSQQGSDLHHHDSNHSDNDIGTSVDSLEASRTLQCRTSSVNNSVFSDDNNQQNNNNNNSTNATPSRFQHAPHGITRIGSFFFFRIPSSATAQNAAYAPSGPSVFGAALDLSMPILFNFHLFIEACNHIQAQGSEAPAKILPIIFLSVLIVRTMVPPTRRGRFWSTMKFTFTAPMHRVRFRDDYIGDVVTSLVRPTQDVLFALSYYCTVIYGTVSGKYGLTRSGELLQESWLLHNVILPSCAILPLWWKYLQTLRQCYDTKQRWPHQGNALKYLTAALVVIYGMSHPPERRSWWWIIVFVAALLYQLWWDVVMDWELFVITPTATQIVDSHSDWITMQQQQQQPNNYFVFLFQLYIWQPALNFYNHTKRVVLSHQIQLRPQRLYKTEAFYWKIFAYNAITRVCWMLCFIPAYHLNGKEREKITTFSSDVNSYLGVILPVIELLRRCFWGFLHLERETLKLMQESNMTYSRNDNSSSNGDDLDEECEGSQNSDDNSKAGGGRSLPTWLDVQQQVAHDAATSNAKRREMFYSQLFLIELYVWAAAFVILGCWAAS